LDEPVGRYPTLFTNPGTPSSSKPRKGDIHTVRLRLLPNGSQERRLRRLADATAKLWNELNYARLIQWREGKHVDFKGTEHEYYHKYKSVLGVNAGQVINLNNWMWNSFFKFLGSMNKASYRSFTVRLHRQASGRTRCLVRGS